MAELMDQVEKTERRFANYTAARERRMKALKDGRIFEADDPTRVRKFLLRRGYELSTIESLLKSGKDGLKTVMTEMQELDHADVGLERVLGEADFLGVCFLEEGLKVARSIARVQIGAAAGRARGYGTGFLIAPRLFMTNNHVLPTESDASSSVVEFDYYVRQDGSKPVPTTFRLDPGTFFLTDVEHDFTLVALSTRGSGPAEIGELGWNRLIEDEGKAIVGQWVNIIQHPNGEPKQLVLRNNQLIDIPDRYLHYQTDTSPGSSGSPVYNDRWEVIALHHSGVPRRDSRTKKILALGGKVWDPSMGEHRIDWIANEGVRVSRLVQFIKNSSLRADQRFLFDQGMEVRTVVRREGDAEAPRVEATSRVSEDGVATWTIPLQVSVSLGAEVAAARRAAAVDVAQPLSTPQPKPVATSSSGQLAGPDNIVAQAKRELTKNPDVMDVRLGYRFKDGWITKERALVVTVRDKATPREIAASGRSLIPQTFGGMPIEVTGPTIDQLLRSSNVLTTEAQIALEDLSGLEIKYEKPQGIPLTTLKDQMTVEVAVSPDYGWPMLEEFIKGTGTTLTIGMYDFGATHIRDAILGLKGKKGLKKVALALQKGQSLQGKTKENDIKDEAMVKALKAGLGKRFDIGWIKTGPKNGWVAKSYHIKVAVRDHRAFWLSSGNWQSSNQPNVKPLTAKKRDFTILDTYNREWHAVVQHPGLAQTFEKYIEHDLTSGTVEALEAAEFLLPDLIVPEARIERIAGRKLFNPLKEKRTYEVTPLLTPDNYYDALMDLVDGAKETLYIQNQTFNAPTDDQEPLDKLMDLILRKQRAGVDVRVMWRSLMASDARKKLEALMDYGFDDKTFKVHGKLHTKGVIVDERWVMIGSQNISNMGITDNRDASLLFDDPKLAKYFLELFNHDWDFVATRNIGNEYARAKLADEAAVIGAGEDLITAKEYLETL